MKSVLSDGNGAIASPPTVRVLVSPDLRLPGHTFHIHPEDRIIAKRVMVTSEEERPVAVTSLNWIQKSAAVAHLVVSFLHHHVEYVVQYFSQNHLLTLSLESLTEGLGTY